MKSRMRILSVLLLCLLLLFLWSAAVMPNVAERDHHCSGDRCAVCFLSMTSKSSFGILLLLSAFLAAFPAPGTGLCPLCRLLDVSEEHPTPVALRVKLLN